MGKVFKKVGQSTLEYVIVLTAIVAAILFAAAQFIRPGVNKVYGDVSNRMNQSGDLFANMIGGGVNLQNIGDTSGGGSTASTGGGSTSGAW